MWGAGQPAAPTLARDIMATRLLTVRPEVDVAEGIHQLLKHSVSGVPVVDADGRYLGVFSEKCCMRVLTRIAERVEERWRRPVRTREFMVKRLITLVPDEDACTAIGRLLDHRVSGAPVRDPDQRFLGVFSEKTSMSVLLQAAYDGTPSGKVRSYMNPDEGRLISEDTDLYECARLFIETPYRRLVVLRDGKVCGQTSRRDVLRTSRILGAIVRHHVPSAVQQNRSENESEVYLAAHRELPATDVRSFMDANARTITEDMDLLAIAQTFLSTPYRRLPVLRDGKAVGQVSRRDVLNAFYHLMDPPAPSPDESSILYVSATRDRKDMPIS